MQLSPGVRVGSFDVGAALGSGGMGAVYRARDVRLGRDVAIKVLHDTEPGLLDRFEREARVLSALNHPNIVTIFGIEELAGVPFIAMELVEGKSLRDILKSGRVPIRKLLNIGTQIAEGLAAAHDRGVVHRDLKPQNVMVTSGGIVKILDFGLARVQADPQDDLTADTTSAVAGRIEGTAAYMSPEQARGAPIDYRSDQFALGTLLYEMATGRQPFRRETTIATMYAIVHEEPDPIQRINDKLPAPFCWIVDRCLAKDPSDRYTSTRDLARELQTVREHLPETAPGVAPVPSASRAPRRTMLLGAAAVLAAAIAIFITSDDAPAIQPQPALPEQKFLAVLPFNDVSGRPDARAFTHGFADAVSSRLSRLEGVQVVPPASSAPLVARNADYRRMAQELGATLLLNATIQRDDAQQLRVSYSLVETRRGTAVGGDTLQGSMRELWETQDRLADAVAADLGVKPKPSPRALSSGLETADEQELYVRALGMLQQHADGKAIDAAIDMLRELLESAPQSPLVHAALGRAYLHQYNLTHDAVWTEKAIAACNRAKALAAETPDVLLTLANLARVTGRHDDAVTSFHRVLELDPESADAAIGLGQSYQRANRPYEAERAFRRGIALRPTWWTGYNELGAFYLAQGRYDEAARQFHRSIELNPESPWSYSNLGIVHISKKELPQAVAVLTKAISIAEDPAAYGNLGLCYYLLGDFEKSAAAYRNSVRLRPTVATQWANLADACTWAQQCRDEASAARAKAIELLQRDLAVNPKSARAHGTLAVCLAKAGRAREAATHMSEALELDPNNPSRFYQAARVANLAGKTNDAIAWLKRAEAAGYGAFELQRDPEFAALRGTTAFKTAFNSAGAG